MENFLQNVEKIAYLGVGGSYTEMAKDIFCDKYKIDAYQIGVKSIAEVMEFVAQNEGAVGVLPVENSIEGTVRETLDCLISQNENIHILSELIMPVKHCLVSRTTELYSISGIIAHPKALAQCSNFIRHEMPLHLNIIETATTDEAAKLLEGYNLTYAAIGTEKTAQIYNLNILKDNINNDQTNQTRFVLVGKFETPQTKSDKTTLAFSTENKAGALLDILEVFHKHNINLSYIDSRPSKQHFGEYTFFVDFDGHKSLTEIAKAIDEIKSQAPFFRFVGSYAKNVVNIS